MGKRIVLNLNRCDECEACSVRCGYFYRPSERDLGIRTLKERATFEAICRRCEHASCLAACPFDALERQDDGSIKRLNLRCVSCKLCTQACPFGTIYPDMVGFYVTPCGDCLREQSEAGSHEVPSCVASCQKGAIEYREVADNEEGIRILDDRLAVIGPLWEKEDV